MKAMRREDSLLLPLQQGILYGPIDSRRLGKSLGVNLMPTTYKLCSFDCVYCHYGSTNVLTVDIEHYSRDLPSVGQVLDEIERAMKSTVEYAYITFSGNGEPTLHPDFREIVSGTADLRNRHRPQVKVALLSNSSGLCREEVKKSIPKIDLPVFKLDAGDEDTFTQINRPAGDVAFSTIVRSLQAVKGIYIQTVLMAGTPQNVSEHALAVYFRTIAGIKPRGVQLYSLDRPVPNRNIKRIPPSQLEEIAKKGRKETGVDFTPFYL